MMQFLILQLYILIKPETLEDRAVWYNQKLDQGYPILVCEQDNRVVGFASFGPFRHGLPINIQ